MRGSSVPAGLEAGPAVAYGSDLPVSTLWGAEVAWRRFNSTDPSGAVTLRLRAGERHVAVGVRAGGLAARARVAVRRGTAVPSSDCRNRSSQACMSPLKQRCASSVERRVGAEPGRLLGRRRDPGDDGPGGRHRARHGSRDRLGSSSARPSPGTLFAPPARADRLPAGTRVGELPVQRVALGVRLRGTARRTTPCRRRSRPGRARRAPGRRPAPWAASSAAGSPREPWCPAASTRRWSARSARAARAPDRRPGDRRHRTVGTGTRRQRHGRQRHGRQRVDRHGRRPGTVGTGTVGIAGTVTGVVATGNGRDRREGDAEAVVGGTVTSVDGVPSPKALRHHVPVSSG